MKEYNFKEVIENIQDGDTYKCTEKVWVVTTISKEEGSIKFNNGDGIHHGGINDKQLFVKVEKPVILMDVFNSDKKCRIEHELIDKIMSDDENDFDFNEYMEVDEVLFEITNQYRTSETKDILLNGRWYLED